MSTPILIPPIENLKIMLEYPGAMYIAHGGRELYVNSPTDGGIVLLTGPDFGVMSDDEINAFIVETAENKQST